MNQKLTPESLPESLNELFERQRELQYAAMAHALTGQPLPDHFAGEYAQIEEKIKRTSSGSPLDPGLIQMNELQYAALAHALAGQPLPNDFAEQYARLEANSMVAKTPMPAQTIKEDASHKVNKILQQLNDMQYEAMAYSLSGEPLPQELAKRYAQLEKDLNAARKNNL